MLLRRITLGVIAAVGFHADISAAQSNITSLLSCNATLVRHVLKPLLSDISGSLVACSRTLDMLPRQYLSLSKPSKSKCRLLQDNKACETFNNEYYAVLATITPPCSTADGDQTNIAVSYATSIESMCKPTVSAPYMATAGNGTNERADMSANSTIITTPKPTPIDVNTPPPSKAAQLSSSSSIMLNSWIAISLSIGIFQ